MHGRARGISSSGPGYDALDIVTRVRSPLSLPIRKGKGVIEMASAGCTCADASECAHNVAARLEQVYNRLGGYCKQMESFVGVHVQNAKAMEAASADNTVGRIEDWLDNIEERLSELDSQFRDLSNRLG